MKSVVALEGSLTWGNTLGGFQHTPCRPPKLHGCLKLLGRTLLSSEWCTKAELLDGICCAGLQLMPHSTPKLPSCLGTLSGALLGSKQDAEVKQLSGVHCVQAFGSCPSTWAVVLSLRVAGHGLA